VRLVVDEDGTQESLLGLEVVGSGTEGRAVGRDCTRRPPVNVLSLAACGFDHGQFPLENRDIGLALRTQNKVAKGILNAVPQLRSAQSSKLSGSLTQQTTQRTANPARARKVRAALFFGLLKWGHARQPLRRRSALVMSGAHACQASM